MKWIVDNWSLLVVIAIIATYVIASGKKSVQEWLLYAVSMAEKDLGGGTGKLKLRYAYDSFVATYPIISKIIPFGVFSMWVDEALDEMRSIIETNMDIKAYLEVEDKA